VGLLYRFGDAGCFVVDPDYLQAIGIHLFHIGLRTIPMPTTVGTFRRCGLLRICGGDAIPVLL
jgi:hypothetical protein